MIMQGLQILAGSVLLFLEPIIWNPTSEKTLVILG